MSSIKFSMDLDTVGQELKRLSRGPGTETILELESKLAEAHAVVFAAVHVETGSLKSTASIESSLIGHVWQGEIKYGGPAPGMPRPLVYYGIYELARGGTHHFFEGAYHTMGTSDVNGVVFDFFRRGRHL